MRALSPPTHELAASAATQPQVDGAAGERNRFALGVSAASVLVRFGLEEFFPVDLLLLELGLAEDVVDDLLLEDGRAQLGDGTRVLLVELVNEALLAGILTGLLDQRAAHLFLRDLDLVLIADLAE